MKKLNKKGFTLIELIVVIAILAILAAILIPAITGYITKATDSKNAANCRALYSQTAMEVMINDSATYVPSIGGTASGNTYTVAASTSSPLAIVYTIDRTNKVVSAFTCTPTTGTTTAIVLK